MFPCNFIRTLRSRHWGRQGRATCYGSFCTFYLYGVLLQWLANLFDNLTAKRFNLRQCQSTILGGLQNKIYSVSPVQIRDRSCGTSTFLAYTSFKSCLRCCDIVADANWDCQDRFISPSFSYRLHSTFVLAVLILVSFFCFLIKRNKSILVTGTVAS